MKVMICVGTFLCAQKGAEYVKKINGIFCFKVKNGDREGVWIIDAKNGNGSLKYDINGMILLQHF
jgi:hypothetical protein